jgi:hypothetical protein
MPSPSASAGVALRAVYARLVDTEGAFVPHKPDPELNGTRIVYAVRLDDFDKLSKRDREKLAKLNPHQANRETPIFYVGQTTLLAWQRYENHRNGDKAGHGWVKNYGQRLIVVDEWEPDFGVALPKKTIKAAWELARHSKADPIERGKAVAELLRAQGYYVMSH